VGGDRGEMGWSGGGVVIENGQFDLVVCSGHG
jgi:hypothetical protein